VSVVGSRRRRSGVRIHCLSELASEDRAFQDGVPVTSLARSIFDYAVTASPQQLRGVIDAADYRELLDHRRLHALLGPGRTGSRKLKTVLAEIKGPAPWLQSELERALLTLIRTHGLPEPSANIVLHGHIVDFAWLRPGETPLVVECDGYEFHRDRATFESDRARDLQLARHGVQTVRITQRRLQTEPDALAGDLKALLRGSELRAPPPEPPRPAR
jgi:very-short-patch-repair endonuclease